MLKTEPLLTLLCKEVCLITKEKNFNKYTIKSLTPANLKPLFTEKYENKVLANNNLHNINDVFKLALKYYEGKYRVEKIKQEQNSTSVWVVRKK